MPRGQNKYYRKQPGLRPSDKIKVAVITGGHPFDVPGLIAMFDRMPQIDYYIQDLDNWAADSGDVWEDYDVHLFYTMHYWGKLSVRKDMDERILAMFDRIGEREHGLFVWHHALLGFIDTPSWSKLCNIEHRRLRGCDAGEVVNTAIADPNHPITRNIQPWTMIDEVYLMDEPDDNSTTILTTDNGKSMTKLAWCHEHEKARVFCYESGHDNINYTDPSFQAVMLRAIQWCARRI